MIHSNFILFPDSVRRAETSSQSIHGSNSVLGGAAGGDVKALVSCWGRSFKSLMSSGPKASV